MNLPEILSLIGKRFDNIDFNAYHRRKAWCGSKTPRRNPCPT